MKNVLIISGVYIATVIGAGFASGQEIVSFFVKYGNASLLGAAAVGILMGAALFGILERCRMNGITDFADYLRFSAGKKGTVFFDVLVTVFMLCVFGTMTACAATLISDTASVKEGFAALGVCLVCFVCFCFDIKGIAVVNAALSPFMIAGIIGVCLYILFFREMSVFAGGIKGLSDNIIISSLGYTSYNLLTAAVIAVNMSGIIKSRRQAALAGKISGGFFLIMIVLLWTVIKIYYGKTELGSVPMLTIVSREGKIPGLIYTAILSVSVMTTAFSSGFGTVNRLGAASGLNKYICSLLVCACGFFLSGVGFSGLIENAYRICGITGIALLYIIMRDFMKITGLIKRVNNRGKKYKKLR
ncbi:MAG: hypothetical protein J1F64_09180 [Oscillospiraceae bacterium]|nr:hypothetical protein [Oscillospiraceae bacterium]